MINKLSKSTLATRKGTYFPIEIIDVCKRICAIKRLHQLAYAQVKLLSIPPD